ncbi:MAG: PDZ domain-containing protein [Planctomycetota bacterium]
MRCLHLFALSMFYVVLVAVSNTGAQDTSENPSENPNETLESGTVVASPGATGQQTSGYLGFTPSVRSSEDKSVYILSVVDGGPAAKSGLKANDDIVEVNGREIEDLQDLDRAIQQAPGTRLTFTVRRDETVRQVKVPVAGRSETPPPPSNSTVGELPAPEPAEKKLTQDEAGDTPRTDEGRAAELQQARPHLGVRVIDADKLDEATRRKFNVSVRSGAVIVGLTEGAPAARAGLPLGGVIVSIDNQRIGTAEDLVELVKSFRPGREIEITYSDGGRLGRKKLHVGPAAAGAAGTPSRRGPDRPLLNALRGMLDDVLPSTENDNQSRGVDRLPPPPPSQKDEAGSPGGNAETPVPPPPPKQPGGDQPAVDINPPAAAQVQEGPDSEQSDPAEPNAEQLEAVEALRAQMVEMHKQLEALQRRVEQLEQKQSP